MGDREQVTSDPLLLRIKDYLTGGGLFNPELANHDAVRDLIIECRDEIERLMNLIDSHNHSCQSMCGFGELEADECGYRPYFAATGRRCPNCPTDWKIER